MRMWAFAKRNFLEIVRDPISSVFCIGFPVLLLFVFRLIYNSIENPVEQEALYQFQIQNLAPSLAVFGFSFITLFSGMLIAKDRTTSFLARLRTSPMTSTDFIFGYTLPLIPLALIQVVLCYGLSFIFGLKLTWGLALSVVGLLPIAILFIALGLIIGSLVNDKAVGGIASIIVNFAALFGGMFMPIETMGKTILVIAKSFPFFNAIRMVRSIISSDYSMVNFGWPLIICLAYTVVFLILSVIIFHKKLTSDNI